jgi:YHS domain-containing protein
VSWLLRLAALLFLVYLLGRVWRWFWTVGWKRLMVFTVDKTVGRAEQSVAPPAYEGTVVRDPVCGTHVDVQLAVQETFKGQTYSFCSEKCRDTFCQRQRGLVDKTG